MRLVLANNLQVQSIAGTLPLNNAAAGQVTQKSMQDDSFSNTVLRKTLRDNLFSGASCALFVRINAVTASPVFEAWLEAYMPMVDFDRSSIIEGKQGDLTGKLDTSELDWGRLPGTRFQVNTPSAGDVVDPVLFDIWGLEIFDIRLGGSATTLDGSNDVTIDAYVNFV